MSTVSGACIVSKISGMIHIKEDATPSVIEWTAIDQSKVVTIPLNALTNLQASKETTPKLMLKLTYKVAEEETKDLKLTFSNRPTMNNVKDVLQSILARSRTVVKDVPVNTRVEGPGSGINGGTSTGGGVQGSGGAGTPGPSSGSEPPTSSSNAILASADNLNFSHPQSLSDAALLKNHTLQQKLLLEDKLLREKFTQAVINFKLSPVMFWQTRLNQLRTFALTISQHRGPYNVLSTIKPVASSDNQVNVNVTRDTIREIFDTYPIIKKSFDDLVPAKFPEGEFWSRFFNSKLFRRLRGDKINNSNERGDVVLDKYLYVDADFVEAEAAKTQAAAATTTGATTSAGTAASTTDGSASGTSNAENKLSDSAPTKTDSATLEPAQKRQKLSKLIDLLANEEDNSQKLGNQPDITMRYGDNAANLLNNPKNKSGALNGGENEMLVIMRNMNKLSSKMVNSTRAAAEDLEDHAAAEAKSLQLQDLHETEEIHYTTLKINNEPVVQESTNIEVTTPLNILNEFMLREKFENLGNGIDLCESYSTKKDDIEKTSIEINSLIKHNFKTFRLGSGGGNMSATALAAQTIIPVSIIQDIITTHITSMELLTHFWRGFLSGDSSQAVATRKIVISLKKCLAHFDTIEEQCLELVKTHTTDEKLREKLTKEVKESLMCDRNGLTRACREFQQALNAAESV
ncbi:general transcription and DNA repair factor IIH subunit Tfb1p [[Candida] anglica]|uniref:General transcription and DNA repair factor IIH subunit Tfb1p n=1 Tax=[Candida] anglica TaxID=148631 RepID=A0ABP0EFG1_9ASCO